MSSHKKRRKNHIKKGKSNKYIDSTTRQTTEEITGAVTGSKIGATTSSITGAIGEEKTSSTTGAIAEETTSSTTDETNGKTASTATGSTTGTTTPSTTGAATGGTTSSILDSLTLDEVTKVRVIIGAIGDLNVAKLSLLGLAINETDRVYYDNRLKPLIDAIFNLGLASGNIATAVNFYQGNIYSEKHEIKKALDITYEINDCIEIAVRILKCRLKYYEENADWCE